MLTKIFRSPHFFAFISCLLFCFAQSQTGTEICNSVGQLSATMSSLAINTPLAVTQAEDECVRFFQLTLNPGTYQANNYLILEVTFDNLSSNLSHRPYLLEKTASTSASPSAGAPQIKFTSTSTFIDADLKDDDGFMNRKSYHNIVIEPSKLPTSGVLYFAMYKYSDQDNAYVKFSVQYTVKVRYSTTYPCPQECSGHGTCDKTAKQCVCDTNYYDLDCSVDATELKVDKTLTQTISPLAYNYFYVELDKDPSNDLILTTKKSGGTVELQLLFTTPTNYSIPNFWDNDGYATITLSNVNQPATIEAKSLKGYVSAGKSVMMLGVYNYADSTNTQVILKLAKGDSSDADDTDDEATRNAIMYAMIGIASVLVILWSIFSVIKYKIYREAEALRRQHQEAAAAQHRETTYLTREEMDKYFPKTNFASLQSSFAQNMCSICLDDFEKGTVCRQLTCEHVFNDTCIEAWLANHDSCPNCKKEMTVSAIETFLKAKKNRKSGLNKLGSINEHDDKHNHTEGQFLGLHVGHPPVNANTARGVYRQSEILDNSHAHINLNNSQNFPIYRDIGQMQIHENPDMVVDISDGREDLHSRGRVRRVHPTAQRIQPRLQG